MESLNSKEIKQAFSKVKEDINFLNNEVLNLKVILNEIKDLLKKGTNILKNEQINTSTLKQINQTYPANSTHYSTVRQEIEGFKTPNLNVSIGNEGASTDRQTDNSTDILPLITSKKTEKSIELDIKQASEILESLDTLKKEIRLKFKHLTFQEMAVFSTIYQIEEQENHPEITYNLLSKQLKLSESSIRDYIQRMINKGIPIKKRKMNNKKILLSISNELKKIASLPTIIKLRDI